jgi:cold shock CspA family protein
LVSEPCYALRTAGDPTASARYSRGGERPGEGGGRDVFVHATALERSGLSPLTEGQAVVMQVVQGKKGPEASTLTRA